MSYENPTRLRVGMHGDFAGRDFRLLGRVVMGVTVDGENYFWNEYNLQAATGETATLVYEETEQGGQWRLFTMFEPENPLTAAEAATKRIGDTLNLNGTEVTVTLVDSSMVYRIEGEPPEGLKVGDTANYFNATAGSTMQVVSWTGDEVEFYNGFTLSAIAVNQAFNLPQESSTPSRIFSRFSSDSDDSSGNYLGMGKFLLNTAIIVILFIIVFGRGISCSNSYEAAAVKHVYAPLKLPLQVGTTGHWDGQYYRVSAHATVEIGQVGAIYERHEYELKDDADKVTVLVCGEKPGMQDWTLYTPVDPLDPPTAQESAAKKAGDPVNVAGVEVTINELFQYKVLNRDTVETSAWLPGEVQYGYAGKSPYGSLLVRWDTNGISFYHGKILPAARVGEFMAAFAAR
jgi:hypothetical protein